MLDREALFRAVEKSGLMTGAWTGVTYDELPGTVQFEIERTLVAHVEKLISDALIRDAMTKIQQDTGVDFGPMWKYAPKHD